MKMKFSQSLDYILRHFNDIARELTNGQRGADLLETWNINVNDADQVVQIRAEREALRYFSSLDIMLVKDRDAVKPAISDLISAFTRHLAFLDDIFGCNENNWRKESDKVIRKQYEACRHYLFQLSLPAFVESLPERVPTFENKHPDFANEIELPIPPND